MRTWASIGVVLVPLLAGCPQGTSVELVNDTGSPVEVELYFGEDQNTSKAFLEEFGDDFVTTVEPGETVRFSRDCEELQAIYIEKAELNFFSGIGPEAQSDLFRDGSDFGCGDALIFTFREEGLFGLDISFEAAPGGIGGLGSLGGLLDLLGDGDDNNNDDDDDDDDFDDIF